MGEKTEIPSTKGEIRRSWLLRQIIHYTLGAAYLARVKEAGGDPRKAANLPNADTVEQRNTGGVE